MKLRLDLDMKNKLAHTANLIHQMEQDQKIIQEKTMELKQLHQQEWERRGEELSKFHIGAELKEAIADRTQNSAQIEAHGVLEKLKQRAASAATQQDSKVPNKAERTPATSSNPAGPQSKSTATSVTPDRKEKRKREIVVVDLTGDSKNLKSRKSQLGVEGRINVFKTNENTYGKPGPRTSIWIHHGLRHACQKYGSKWGAIHAKAALCCSKAKVTRLMNYKTIM
uniref:Uncharacterized protein n=1 Tax=Entomoneis paludosa TaxID=265537 RepID=A0A7S3DNH6_9STRA|mmetsp:Transcript_23117/g.48151  ORF Transcript_23117/g.48151 Transcript_23117/m.48151 type:complete len:225 (+) Transcript_23117:486-1160(+)